MGHRRRTSSAILRGRRADALPGFDRVTGLTISIFDACRQACNDEPHILVRDCISIGPQLLRHEPVRNIEVGRDYLRCNDGPKEGDDNPSGHHIDGPATLRQLRQLHHSSAE